MDQTTTHQTAVAAIERAETAGSLTAALAVFDALDQHAADLTAMDRYDFALSTWSRHVDGEFAFTDAEIVTLVVRAAAHLPEHTVIDLVEARFGDEEKRIRLDDGRGLAWFPGDDIAVLSWPMAGGIADIVLGRSRRTVGA
jgi:hypothetical protein